MKMLFLLFVLTFAGYSTFAKEDSLIANIGKKARVIFYAEKPEDLKEIERYDLNLLFKQLKRRSEKNFSLTEEVSLKDADELKNREANRVVNPQSWFRNMNLNLFVGSTRATVQGHRSPHPSLRGYEGHFLGYLIRANGSNSLSRGIYRIENEPAMMLGIGGFFDKNLLQKRKYGVGLRYGAGFDFINTKLFLKQSGTLSSLLDSASNEENPFFGIEATKRRILSTNLYAELQPTFHFINRKGEKTFKVGAGIKVAASLNNLNKGIITDDYFQLRGSPLISVKYKALQTALTATVGYRFVNLFFQATPGNVVITSTSKPQYISYESPAQLNATSYIIGLRFGK